MPLNFTQKIQTNKPTHHTLQRMDVFCNDYGDDDDDDDHSVADDFVMVTLTPRPLPLVDYLPWS